MPSYITGLYLTWHGMLIYNPRVGSINQFVSFIVKSLVFRIIKMLFVYLMQIAFILDRCCNGFEKSEMSLQWHHNGHDGVSNHQPHDCLLNRLFRCRSKKTSKLHIIGLCVGNSPVTGDFPVQMDSKVENVSIWSWWLHQMETFPALLAICVGNSPVPGEFPTQRPVTRKFDVYFDLRLNKRLCKQTWGWWLETLLCPLWRHSNVTSSWSQNG